MSQVDVLPAEKTEQAAVVTWPHLAGRFLFWLGWAIVAVLLLVVLLRLVAWDDIQVFAWADALGLVLYLPAWVIGIAAAILVPYARKATSMPVSAIAATAIRPDGDGLAAT